MYYYIHTCLVYNLSFKNRETISYFLYSIYTYIYVSVYVGMILVCEIRNRYNKLAIYSYNVAIKRTTKD